jgi:hypothetical protein
MNYGGRFRLNRTTMECRNGCSWSGSYLYLALTQGSTLTYGSQATFNWGSGCTIYLADPDTQLSISSAYMQVGTNQFNSPMLLPLKVLDISVLCMLYVS